MAGDESHCTLYFSQVTKLMDTRALPTSVLLLLPPLLLCCCVVVVVVMWPRQDPPQWLQLALSGMSDAQPAACVIVRGSATIFSVQILSAVFFFFLLLLFAWFFAKPLRKSLGGDRRGGLGAPAANDCLGIGKKSGAALVELNCGQCIALAFGTSVYRRIMSCILM